MLSPIRKKSSSVSKQRMCRRGHGLLDGFRDLSLVESFHDDVRRKNRSLCQKRSTVWRGCDDGSLGDDSNSSGADDENSVDNTCLWDIFMARDLSPRSNKKENRIPKMSTPSSSFKKKSKSQNQIYKYFPVKQSPVVKIKKNKQMLFDSQNETKIQSAEKCESSEIKERKLSPRKLCLGKSSSSVVKKEAFKSPSKSNLRQISKNKENESSTQRTSQSRKNSRSRSPMEVIAAKRKATEDQKCLTPTQSPIKKRKSKIDTPRPSEKLVKLDIFTTQSLEERNVDETNPSTKTANTNHSISVINSIVSSKVNDVKISPSGATKNPRKVQDSSTRKFSFIKKSVTEPRLKRKMESPIKSNNILSKKKCDRVDLNLSKSSISFRGIFNSLETESEHNLNSSDSAFYPKKPSKECISCLCTSTPVWRDTEEGVILCNACGIRWRTRRVRCTSCWHIPLQEEMLNYYCSKCGNFNSYKKSNRLRRFTSSIY